MVIGAGRVDGVEEAGVVCGCRGTGSRRARVVKGMDWKPIVISRAGSSPAVDAKCRMAEVCRKGTLGSVLAWRAASLLLIRLLFVLKLPL